MSIMHFARTAFGHGLSVQPVNRFFSLCSGGGAPRFDQSSAFAHHRDNETALLELSDSLPPRPVTYDDLDEGIVICGSNSPGGD